ncbi:hypothetical protein D3C84_1180350 [compost metagenome]
MVVGSQFHAAHAQLFRQFTGSRFGVGLIGLHHAARRHVPEAGVNGLAQGTPMNTQLTGRIEQHDVGAASDQATLTQL